MSRINAASRNLTLTEELEKLEQSITLTLQEIDHNFSRAHRIVTTSVLPVVQQYTENSRSVWEGSKFWKEFFEASANVSLGAYEVPSAEDEETVTTTTADSTFETTQEGDKKEESISHLSQSQSSETSSHQPTDIDAFLSSPSHSSTPRAPPTTKVSTAKNPTFADYPSPYEALRREHASESESGEPSPEPVTPGRNTTASSRAQTPESSPFLPPPSTAHQRSPQKSNDPLLHRLLDKTYRLQATPHHTTSAIPRPLRPHSPTTELSSSPPVPAPELHSEVFSSPFRVDPSAGPRTPGVSVLTPAHKGTRRRLSMASGESDDIKIVDHTARRLWEDDSSDDDFTADVMGISPPKTIQFHVPQSRLLQTPAREASRRIVNDLLLTAGGGQDVTADLSGQSPSTEIVKPAVDLDDEITWD
ncbi:MAG: DASH complex subunit ask1 [Cirrosporium novae-zelandiae]|nr:MAG: DASH complex subunit ask1 [Cirrosporium novae-zelandiae]